MPWLTVIAVIAFNYGLRKRHRAHAERLRNQIASDLHDDIGSNLKTARQLGMTTIKVVTPEQALGELEAEVAVPRHEVAVRHHEVVLR